MKKLPKIHVVKTGKVVEGQTYRFYIGYKDGEIVCLALSQYGWLTFGMLCEELSEELRDAVFEETPVFLDVYHNPAFRVYSPVAKFWSQRPMGRFEEKHGGSFLTEEMEKEWKEALGMMVIFSPCGRSAGQPEDPPKND